MFVTLGNELKFHYWYDNKLDTYSLENQHLKTKFIDVSFSHDNNYMVCLRQNEKPQIFSLKNKQNIHLLHVINIQDAINVHFIPTTKKFIVLTTENSNLIVYNLRERTVLQALNRITSQQIKSIQFNCNGRILCCIDDKNLITIRDLFDNTTIEKFQLFTPPTVLKSHPYQQHRMIIGTETGHIIIWDLQEHCESIILEITNHPIAALVVSNCGNFIIIGAKYDLIIAAIDYHLKKTTFQFVQQQTANIVAMDLCPVEDNLIIGLEDGSIVIFNTKSYQKSNYIGQINENLTKIRFYYHPKCVSLLKMRYLQMGNSTISSNSKVVCGKFRNLMEIVVDEIVRVEDLFVNNFINHRRIVQKEFDNINKKF